MPGGEETAREMETAGKGEAGGGRETAGESEIAGGRVKPPKGAGHGQTGWRRFSLHLPTIVETLRSSCRFVASHAVQGVGV